MLQLERCDNETKMTFYASLSHAWGNDEVSLQQFQSANTGNASVRGLFDVKAALTADVLCIPSNVIMLIKSDRTFALVMNHVRWSRL
jgi:hypothetical protein